MNNHKVEYVIPQKGVDTGIVSILQSGDGHL